MLLSQLGQRTNFFSQACQKPWNTVCFSGVYEIYTRDFVMGEVNLLDFVLLIWRKLDWSNGDQDKIGLVRVEKRLALGG